MLKNKAEIIDSATGKVLARLNHERPEYCEECDELEYDIHTTFYYAAGKPCVKHITLTCKHDAACKRLHAKLQTNKREYEKSSQEGLPLNWTRATFIVREDLLEKLKDLAYTERRSIKEVINEAIEQFIDGKEIIERGDK